MRSYYRTMIFTILSICLACQLVCADTPQPIENVLYDTGKPDFPGVQDLCTTKLLGGEIDGNWTGLHYRSQQAPDDQTFEGDVYATSDNTQLALFCDDGSTVAINGTVPLPTSPIGRFNQPQALPDFGTSLVQVNYPLNIGQVYHIQVHYSNVYYFGSAGDVDGCSLFVYGGGVSLVGASSLSQAFDQPAYPVGTPTTPSTANATLKLNTATTSANPGAQSWTVTIFGPDVNNPSGNPLSPLATHTFTYAGASSMIATIPIQLPNSGNNYIYKALVTNGPSASSPMQATSTISVVQVDHIEYSLNGGTSYQAIPVAPTPLNVPVGQTVTFKAIYNSSAIAWPIGKPIWGGATATGDTANATFQTLSTNTSDTQKVTAECGNLLTACVVVVGVDMLEYSLTGSAPYLVMPPTLFIPINQVVTFHATPDPFGATWPDNKPVWGGTIGITGTGDTTSYKFSKLLSSTMKHAQGTNVANSTKLILGATNGNTVTAESGNIRSANIVPVQVEKIQYSLTGGAPFNDMPTTPLYVAIGQTVTFLAVATPAGANWPDNKPSWGGNSGANGTGGTTTVNFPTASTTPTDYKQVTAECGNTVTANVIVVAVVAVTVDSGATQTNVIGARNWATVKDATGKVIVRATISPALTPVPDGLITWQNGDAVAGQPLQHSLSKANSAEIIVKAACGTSSYFVDIWVVWATMVIDMQDKTPPNAVQFGTLYDGTENLGSVIYNLDQEARGKVVPVAQLSPPGMQNVIKNGWDINRTRVTHSFKDGNKDTENDSWEDTDFPDHSENQYMNLAPDNNAKIYDRDAPNIQMWGSSSYEKYSNFTQWVTWNEIICSDKYSWYWKAQAKEEETPQIILREIKTGVINPLPIRSAFFFISGKITLNGLGLQGINAAYTPVPYVGMTVADGSYKIVGTFMTGKTYRITPSDENNKYNYTPEYKDVIINGADVDDVNFTATLK